MINRHEKNQALLKSIWLPSIFLSVALLGGLRIDAETRAFLFLGPPLITLILAVLLAVLFVRGRLVVLRDWLSFEANALANVSHALTLVALFFASAQAVNAVLPEQGLLHWLFSFLLLWTLWNNQFSAFDARRLLRSLAVLFGTAFLLKHLLLAGLYAPGGSWLTRVAGVLLEGVSLGTLDAQVYAPATGYISFFALLLYVVGLLLLIPATDEHVEANVMRLFRAYEALDPADRSRVRQALLAGEGAAQTVRPADLLNQPARLTPHSEE